MLNNPLVSLCVLTFNRCSLLKELLTELENLTYKPLEIIVIDNHSEDQTQEIMGRYFPKIKYIRTQENIGAAGRNIGMKLAHGEIIISLDDDICGLEDAGIGILVSKFLEDQNLGAITFKCVDIEGQICNWVHHCKEEDYFDKEFITYEIAEGAVAFRKSTLEIAGYYPSTFFLSHEGPDLAFRIMQKGYKVIYSGHLSVKHLFGQGGRKSWRNYYYDTRNQLWLAARNFPIFYALKYLVIGLSSMLIYSIRDGYVRYWIKGVVDGILGINQALNERNVLSSHTINILKKIDAGRPTISYMIKRRLLSKENNLIRPINNIKK